MQSNDLKVDESSLTGESDQVEMFFFLNANYFVSCLFVTTQMNMFRRRAHDYDMNLEAKSLKIWWFFCHEFHFFLGKILSKSVKGFLEVWSTPFPTLPLIRQMRPWRIPNYPNPNPTLDVFRWTRVCLSTRWCCLGPTWWRAAARFSSLPSASTPRLKSTIDALWILSAKVTF